MKKLLLILLALIFFIENSIAQPSNTDPFELYLDCTIKFFQNGTDTGAWSSGVLVSIKNGYVEFATIVSGKWRISEISDNTIGFSSLESYGSINRLNGELMLVDSATNTVSKIGDCKRAIPKF